MKAGKGKDLRLWDDETARLIETACAIFSSPSTNIKRADTVVDLMPRDAMPRGVLEYTIIL
jgi:hypothetical protein